MPSGQTCAQCGVIITIWRRPRASGVYFCSNACRGAYQGAQQRGEHNPQWRGGKKELICKQCHASFQGDPGSKRQFCSRTCHQAWQRQGNLPKGQDNPTWIGRITKVCEVCRAVFIVRPSENDRRFCSNTCVAEWNKKRDYNVEHGGYSTRPRPCDECGKIYRPTNDLRRARFGLHFCSKACKGKWSARTHRGKDHHMWKGGHIHYYGPNWNAQKRAARKRDGNKCRVCGATKGQRVTKTGKKVRALLDVHHIRPFREFGYIIGENENYLQANDLTNLITLCPHCHKKAEFGSIPIQGYLL